METNLRKVRMKGQNQGSIITDRDTETEKMTSLEQEETKAEEKLTHNN